MKPVTMRHDSDCTASVLAALFEVPIETMPDFWTAKTSTAMYDRVRKWCAARGYHWLYTTYGGSNCPRLRDFVKAKPDAGSTFPPYGYWVASISSVDRLRDHDPNHAVVMQGRRLVFNPGGDVKQALHESWFLIGYYLLTPLDPSRMAQATPRPSGTSKRVPRAVEGTA